MSMLVTKELSAREHAALMLYARYTVTEIAQRLSISVKTASTYLSRAQEKLRLNTRRELLAYAQEKAPPQQAA